ncbi:hypothetical protein HCDSEM_055 [Candidatus Hodgkinia cicadicola Dsem]|nr:hypothetical protein HCDSEM_055 [Candidatus Hodgkinia cicadicola Dsem]
MLGLQAGQKSCGWSLSYKFGAASAKRAAVLALSARWKTKKKRLRSLLSLKPAK